MEPGDGLKHLPEEQIEEYRDAFHLFDRDGNGKVSSEELGPLMRCLGSNPNGDHLQELINEVDYDGDGVLNFVEFVDLMFNEKIQIDEDLELIEAFRSFDSDDNGFCLEFVCHRNRSTQIQYWIRYINSADLREAFRRMNEGLSDVEDLIDAANVRIDRKITFDEFVALIVPKV